MKYIISEAYRKARHRLLLFDYDGTLVDIAPTPAEAPPTPRMLSILERLSHDTKNTIVIISGRDKGTIDSWLVDKLNINFAAEHGFFLKSKKGKWHSVAPISDTWHTPVEALIQAAVEQVPGSFIERKQTALVWQYQLSDQELAKAVEKALYAQLQELATSFNLTLQKGHCVLEIKTNTSNKGNAARNWLNEDYDFILAAGDDVTDEDLFKALPDTSYSIKIGKAPTAAKETLDSPSTLLDLLDSLR